MLFSVVYVLCFCARLLIDALWLPAGKGLTSWVSIDSFHIVSAHAPNSLVPRYLREITR